MSTLGSTEGQRFCQRCGSALDRGRCPIHGFDVSLGTPVPAVPAPAPGFPTGGPAFRVGPAATPRPSYAAPRSYASAAPAFENLATPPPPPPIPPPVHNTSWSPEPAPLARERSRPAGRSGSGSPVLLWVVTALAVVLLIALIGDHFILQSSIDSNHRTLNQLDQRLSAQLAAMNALAGKVGTLENQSSDPAAVAAAVRASVFTIDTPDGLGSGWVVKSADGSSDIVTDYHVIDTVWISSGPKTVQVKQESKNLSGTITKVDKGDDLAVITVKSTLPVLPRSTADAAVGDAVLIVGSPLGLAGTVASGIVSSFRNGLIQFSAPISPGDSGGPVVNRRGQVIGVAESKLVGSGVEGLSFAIPIATVCSTVTTC